VLVGIGIANVMVTAVLDRRGEIGLRRALGTQRAHIGIQFVTEAALLAVIGPLEAQTCLPVFIWPTRIFDLYVDSRSAHRRFRSAFLTDKLT
jgi:cell division protein FtsX